MTDPTTPGNGIKLEHRLSTLEAEVKHISQTVEEMKALMIKHAAETTELRLAVQDKINKVDDMAKENRVWIRSLVWILGATSVLGGGAAGLLKLIGG